MNRTNGICRNVNLYVPDNSRSPENSKPLSSSRIDRRSVGCQQVNGTTYSTGGNTFEIFCDTYYWWTSILFVDYTINFPSCMDRCLAWNENTSVKCLGTSWAYGQYGPSGPSGGGNCYFFWDISQPSTNTAQDSGQLLISATAVCTNSD